MSKGYYNATIVFETGTGGENHYRSYTKLFSGARHLNNYIDSVIRKRGWYLDELFINDGYPFKEGDTYYTVEDSKIVKSCWDDVSEEMYDKRTQYFDTYQRAHEYAKISTQK